MSAPNSASIEAWAEGVMGGTVGADRPYARLWLPSRRSRLRRLWQRLTRQAREC